MKSFFFYKCLDGSTDFPQFSLTFIIYIPMLNKTKTLLQNVSPKRCEAAKKSKSKLNTIRSFIHC